MQVSSQSIYKEKALWYTMDTSLITAWPNTGERSKVTSPAWNQTPVTQPSSSWPNQYHQSNNKLKPPISQALASSHLTSQSRSYTRLQNRKAHTVSSLPPFNNAVCSEMIWTGAVVLANKKQQHRTNYTAQWS
jgi:hypothetical protein